MRELASFRRASALLCKVWTFANVLLVAVQTLLTETKNSKVTADTVTFTDADMREKTVSTSTPAVVGEMNTERGTFGSRIM